MKRPRSYGEDLDDDAWPRRDPDPDRPPAHHHRRHSSAYSKPPDGARKGGGPPLDDDRELSSSSTRRKRFDYEPDGFDRRKPGGGFDRHRDSGAGDRSAQAVASSSMSSSSSPASQRGSYGSDRMYYRSESFSVLRREFPKGFRSERDRSRREGSGGGVGSWWRRSNSLKDVSASAIPAAAATASDAATDESKKSPSADSDSTGQRGRAVSLEDRRGKVKSRDSSSGEQRSSRTDTVKMEKQSAESYTRESGSDNEMEEGELEPDLEPERQPEAEPSTDAKASGIGLEMENCESRDLQSNTVSKTSSEKKENLLSEKLVADGGSEADKKDEAKLADMVTNQVSSVQMVLDIQQDTNNQIMTKREVEGEGEGEVQSGNAEGIDVELSSEKQKMSVQENDNPCLPCKSRESRGNEAGWEVDEEQEKILSVVSRFQEKKPENHNVEARGMEAKPEAMQREETGMNLEVEQKEQRGIDLESETDGATGLFDSSKKIVSDNNWEGVTLKLMTDKPKEDCKDKGKSLAISVFHIGAYAERGDAVEGPSGRGFELFSQSETKRDEKAQPCGVLGLKHKDENLKLETLDLSLSLPGASADHPPKRLKHKPDSPSPARSIQSLPSSFRTSSDGFTTSISFTSSQPFVHNPSCSLTQNSLDNYENSVGSHPLFQGMDHVSNGSIRQGHSSNDTKPKGVSQLFNRASLKGNTSQIALQNLNNQHQSKPNGLLRQSSLSRQLSPTCSQGSRDSRSQHSRDKRLLARERSSSSLFRGEHKEGEHFAVNGAGVTEKILSKIVAEPLHLNGRMLQNMTEQSIAYLKETIYEMLMDEDKSRQLHALREALQRRSDMTMDMLTNCPKVLLEILVALKTGLADFTQRANNIQSSELVEIFLNLKCRNLACRSMLPVDDCDCKVCVQKNGFCSACMCLVCSKFDNASNTCSWVGCDVCLHWCHTDCGLRDSHIKNGCNASGDQGTNEVQFHCIACNHPSEMFGFVKEVFKTCAKDWKAETLAMELQYVRRIFSLSNDVRGKRLCDVAQQMLVKLENKANLSEVVSYVMASLCDSDTGINSSPSLFLVKESARSDSVGSKVVACLSKDAKLLQSVPSEKVSLMGNVGLFSSIDSSQVTRKARDAELQLNLEKKPVIDELESVVKFKQAEANMYQERADAARREAEGLKRIAKAKNDKIEEDYGSRIARLRLPEAEERRKKKLEELQAVERTHREYFNMKIRMEADIKDLLVKMEATRRNFNT